MDRSYLLGLIVGYQVSTNRDVKGLMTFYDSIRERIEKLIEWDRVHASDSRGEHKHKRHKFTFEYPEFVNVIIDDNFIVGILDSQSCKIIGRFVRFQYVEKNPYIQYLLQALEKFKCCSKGRLGHSHLYRDFECTEFEKFKGLSIRVSRIKSNPQRLHAEQDKEALLAGTLLGDSSISIDGRFQLNHCIAQEEWLKYKVEKIGLKGNLFKGRSGEFECARFTSETNENWKNLRLEFYPNNKKSIEKLAGLLNSEGFTWWYLDDGGTCRKHFRISIGCSLETAQNIRKILFKKFKLFPSIYPIKGRPNNFVLFFGKNCLRTFLEIVSHHTPACMAYKLGIYCPDDIVLSR